ncbi:MAG: PliI family lysozyme inhibitor of I-type lysozyme [Phenylobacterium sp.]
MLRTTIIAAALALAASASGAADLNRIVLNGSDATLGVNAVADEGEGEPRSIGSYALRLYKAGDPSFPYDAFIAGAVRPRDGTLEALNFADIDRDGRPEVIVVARSAGSGGYLSADAFRLQKDALVLAASKSGLPADADPVAALSSGRKGRK